VSDALLKARRTAEHRGSEVTRLYDAESEARQASDDDARRTQVLFETVAGLSDAVTPKDVAAVVVRQGVSSLGAAGGAVHAVSADGRSLELLHAEGYPSDLVAQYLQVPIDGDSAIGMVARSREPLYLADRAAIGRAFPQVRPHQPGERAFAGLPVLVDGVPIAVISLGFPSPQAFPQSERDLHATLAQQTGQALERARLYDSERRARAQSESSRAALALLSDASRVLSESLDYERTLQQVAELAVGTLADWCSVDIVRIDGSVVSMGSAHVDPKLAAELRRYRATYPPDTYDLGPSRVVRTGSIIHIAAQTSLDLATGNDPRIVAILEELGARSYLCVPVPGEDGRCIGALTFGAREAGRLDERAVEVATELGRRLGVAVEHSRLYRDARQLVATVDEALDAVFVFEPVGLRFIYVNQGAANQVGYSREELIGMSALAIKPDFDEKSYRDLIEPLLSGRQPSVTFYTTHLHRDGTRVPVEAFLQAVRLPGEDVRVIVTARDIRQQIEVEANLYRLARAERARAAELSAVIRGMGEGVLVCDPLGRVILSNPAAASILSAGVDTFDEFHGLVEGGDDMPQLAQLGGPFEVRVVGSDRWLEISTYPVSLDSGDAFDEAETTIILIRDITAARRARAAREAFIGVMSHELRTPITTIYGTTKLFDRAADSPELMRSMLSDVEAEADRLYRLVEDLLILSRSESGIEIEGEPVLLQHVVRAVLAAESSRWPATRFISSVPAGLPPVSGDRTYLEQVVRNLLSNAAKYGPKGGVVEVRADLEGPSVAVRVLDNGPGFAGDEAKHLFELFYRSPSTAKKATGAGIGLYVCRALIQAMGGDIWARARPEGGAEFGFTVPVLEAEPDDVGWPDNVEYDGLDEASIASE
jgi:PAS domain S-box-containing protein